MRLIEIEWEDSVTHSGGPWQDKDELKTSAKPAACSTAGYLFHEDDHALTVVLSFGEDEVGVGITIPRSAVLRVHDLGRLSTQLS